MLFDVKKPIDYYVESDDVRSATYHMKVVELPAVAKLELEYVFPAYTRSSRRRRSIRPATSRRSAAPKSACGSRRRCRRRPVDCRSSRPASPELTAQSDGTLTGSFKIDQDGFYHVELDSSHGDHVAASPKYTVDMIEDQPPSVRFDKPKRDVSANPVAGSRASPRAPTTTSA